MISWNPTEGLLLNDPADLFTALVETYIEFDIVVSFTPSDEFDDRSLDTFVMEIDDILYEPYFTFTPITEIDGVPLGENQLGYKVSSTVPLSVFDQYSVTYVDKGSSDKIMTPITVEVPDVPDYKDVFIVTVDPREEITITFTGTATTTEGTSVGEFTYPAITDTKQYSVIIRQTYDQIRDWVLDYFQNRYEV